MATQEARLLAVVEAIAADVKALFLRVLIPGGSTGQVLAKSSATNYAVEWITPSTGGGSGVPGWRVTATATGVSQSITLPATVTVGDIQVYVNGVRWTTGYSIVGTQLTLIALSNSDILIEFIAGIAGPAGTNSLRGFKINITGKTLAGEVYPDYAPYAFTSTVARCWAIARVPFTSLSIFTLKKNNVTVATITFSASATAGVWSANVTWADGDFVTLESPATPDATGADITIGARE